MVPSATLLTMQPWCVQTAVNALNDPACGCVITMFLPSMIDDAYPYWPAIPHLRTDTAGFLAFAIAVVCLVISRYLQLGRRNGAPPEPAARPRPARILAVQAVRATATRPGQPAAVPKRAGVAA